MRELESLLLQYLLSLLLTGDWESDRICTHQLPDCLETEVIFLPCPRSSLFLPGSQDQCQKAGLAPCNQAWLKYIGPGGVVRSQKPLGLGSLAREATGTVLFCLWASCHVGLMAFW